MGAVTLLLSAVIIILLLLVYLLFRLLRTRRQLQDACAVLDDIAAGNLERRIVAEQGNMAAELCYKINEIVISYKEELLKLRRSEQAYKQLVTSLSHDIRTPLATLLGYLEAVSQDIVTGTERDEYTASALRKAYDLKNYVDILFEWLKLEAGERKFYFEQTDIHEITRHVIADFIPSIEKHGIEYEFDIPDDVLTLPLDRSAYTRIASNLIGNVLAHSEADHVAVRLRQAGEMVELSVCDNGKGIEEADLPYVFDRLYRCDDARSQYGSGLGLAIVQELVRAHGGSVSVSSVPHRETAFTVALPITRA